MTQAGQHELGRPPFAPPAAGSGVPNQQTTWPLVLGVIAIVIASLGILGNGCGSVVAPLVQMLMAKMVPPGSNPMLDAQIAVGKKYMWVQLANALTLSGLGVIMLCAGIGLVRRRSWARAPAMVWALLRIIVTAPASYFGYLIATETMQAMVQASNSGAPGARPLPAGMASFFQIFGVVGVLIGAAVVCAFPIFTLVWFSRAKIRAEMSSWGSRTPG